MSCGCVSEWVSVWVWVRVGMGWVSVGLGELVLYAQSTTKDYIRVVSEVVGQ